MFLSLTLVYIVKRANSAETKCVCSTEEMNILTDSGQREIFLQMQLYKIR